MRQALSSLCVRCAFGLLWVLFSLSASAEAQLGPEGSPIDTSDYSVDLTRGVVVSTSRVIGLSGAATSLAQGVEGGLQNPSAVAYRGAQWPDWYDYWLAAGVTYPFQSGDFYNSGGFASMGRVEEESTVFFIPGFYWQMWNFGIGLTIDAQFLKLSRAPDSGANARDPVRLRFTTFHIQAGYGFFDGQLIIGAGIRILRQRSYVSDGFVSDGDLYQTLGLGGELGVMFKPHDKRWSLGAALFPKISTGLRNRGDSAQTPDGDVVVGGFYLPLRTTLPTSGSVGFAYQFGPRPSNPPWLSAEKLAADELERLDRRKARLQTREDRALAAVRASGGPDVDMCVQAIRQSYARKYDDLKRARKEIKNLAWEQLRREYRWGWPRRYYLLTADVWFNGRVQDGVGVESFIFQTVQRSGQKVTVSPRVGFETEVWPTRMKLRAGSYIEPSRFAESTLRVHGTFGFDVSLFKWNVFGLWPDDYRWQITTAFDFARAYGSFSFGIGGWY